MASDTTSKKGGRKHTTLAILTGLLTLPATLLVVGRLLQPSATTEPESGRRFQPVRVVPPLPAIRKPPVIAASKVSGQVSDGELVLGVEIDGQARAYPINMLTGPSREIINDTLGGKPVAATW